MSDTTAPVVAGDHYKQITPHLAVCSTAGSDGMFEGEGDDRLTGGPGRDGLHGGPGTDTVNGGAGDDFLYADAGGDTVDGGDGNDFLDGGLRGDDLTGGDGGDTVSYASRGSGAPVAVTLGPGQPAANDGADPNRDGTSAGSEEGDDVEEVEHVTGGAGPDILVGSAVANSLRGGLGNDRLDGGLGADLLDARRDRFVRVAPALNAC